jgi:hypothetical protein
MSSEQPISGSTAPVKHGEGHGGPARGYKWKDFEPGNLAAVKHGAQSLILLKPRAAEIADAIREAKGDAWSEEFTPAAEVAALALARVERALGFLLELDEATIEENFSRLDDRAKGWARLALQSLEARALLAVGAVRGAFAVEQRAVGVVEPTERVHAQQLLDHRVVALHHRSIPGPARSRSRAPARFPATPFENRT